MPDSKNKIVNDGWGSRTKFQASYGLNMSAGDLEEGNRILGAMQQADEEQEQQVHEEEEQVHEEEEQVHEEEEQVYEEEQQAYEEEEPAYEEEQQDYDYEEEQQDYEEVQETYEGDDYCKRSKRMGVIHEELINVLD
jgi:hypothetical protein